MYVCTFVIKGWLGCLSRTKSGKLYEKPYKVGVVGESHSRKEMNFDEGVGRDGGIKVKYIFESVLFT